MEFGLMNEVVGSVGNLNIITRILDADNTTLMFTYENGAPAPVPGGVRLVSWGGHEQLATDERPFFVLSRYRSYNLFIDDEIKFRFVHTPGHVVQYVD